MFSIIGWIVIAILILVWLSEQADNTHDDGTSSSSSRNSTSHSNSRMSRASGHSTKLPHRPLMELMDASRSELVDRARALGIDGLFRMDKNEIAEAVHREQNGQSSSFKSKRAQCSRREILNKRRKDQGDSLESMHRFKLVDIAREEGIDGLFLMKKEEIVAAIRNAEPTPHQPMSVNLDEAKTRALLLKRQGSITEARGVLDRAMKAASPSLDNMALSGFGKICYLDGDYKTAFKHYLLSLHTNLAAAEARRQVGQLNVDNWMHRVPSHVVSPRPLPIFWISYAEKHVVAPLVLTQDSLLMHVGHAFADDKLEYLYGPATARYVDDVYRPGLVGSGAAQPNLNIEKSFIYFGLELLDYFFDWNRLSSHPTLNDYDISHKSWADFKIEDPEKALQHLESEAEGKKLP